MTIRRPLLTWDVDTEAERDGLGSVDGLDTKALSFVDETGELYRVTSISPGSSVWLQLSNRLKPTVDNAEDIGTDLLRYKDIFIGDAVRVGSTSSRWSIAENAEDIELTKDGGPIPTPFNLDEDGRLTARELVVTDGTANQFEMKSVGTTFSIVHDDGSESTALSLTDNGILTIDIGIRPGATGTGEIGSAAFRWQNMYIAGEIFFGNTGAGATWSIEETGDDLEIKADAVLKVDYDLADDIVRSTMSQETISTKQRFFTVEQITVDGTTVDVLLFSMPSDSRASVKISVMGARTAPSQSTGELFATVRERSFFRLSDASPTVEGALRSFDSFVESGISANLDLVNTNDIVASVNGASSETWEWTIHVEMYIDVFNLP